MGTRKKRKRANGKRSSAWCHRPTRFAVYARDGFCCLYCRRGSETGRGLTLDHVQPRELGGSNAPYNLVTACCSCNSRKQSRTTRGWLAYMRARGMPTAGLAERIRRQLVRPIDRAEGRRLAQMRPI